MIKIILSTFVLIISSYAFSSPVHLNCGRFEVKIDSGTDKVVFAGESLNGVFARDTIKFKYPMGSSGQLNLTLDRSTLALTKQLVFRTGELLSEEILQCNIVEVGKRVI
jgi:hypothetical protein